MMSTKCAKCAKCYMYYDIVIIYIYDIVIYAIMILNIYFMRIRRMTHGYYISFRISCIYIVQCTGFDSVHIIIVYTIKTVSIPGIGTATII